MKKIANNKLLLILFSLMAMSIWSCLPEENPDDPFADPRDKWIGSWSCNENSEEYGNQTYSVTIENNPSNSSEILINNIYHFGFDEAATALVTNNTATIFTQSICDNTCTINGSGSFQGSNKINWNYYVNDGADIDTVSAVFTRQ